MQFQAGLFGVAATFSAWVRGADPGFTIMPAGAVVEQVAADPLVRYPLFACFDDRGRLFVAEGTGKNLSGPEIAPLKLGKVALLEDVDGDGEFDQRTVFADQLIFPQGVLWHEGSVYVASHPAIWKFTDTNGDGVADEREELVGKFGFTGNGCDIHGPFAGPDGWLYWTQGRHGYKITTREGKRLEGLAARVWRCRPDGTGIERIAGGGFDNIVELDFTERGELVGTMDQYPGDMVLQFIEGGVYPRADQPVLAEFPSTGPMLGPVASFSAAYPAALCGLMRIRSDHFGVGYRGTVLTTQFNIRRLQQHVLTNDGAALRSANRDFLVSSDWDFHPTDALEDADGSLLVVDMGSWFNFQCPTQKIAKAEVTGSILRVRNAKAASPEDPWGKKIPWQSLSPTQLAAHLRSDSPKLGARATSELVRRGDRATDALRALVNDTRTNFSAARREALYALSRIGTAKARAEVRAALRHADDATRQVALHCVSVERDAAALPELGRIVIEDSPALRRVAAEAIGRIGDKDGVSSLLESLRRGAADAFLQHSLTYALIRLGAFEPTLTALRDGSPVVQRAGLVALDQMNGIEKPTPQPPRNSSEAQNPHRGDTFRYTVTSPLTREHVRPLLDTGDRDLQMAILDVAGRRPGWSEELLSVARTWIHVQELAAMHQQALVDALIATAHEDVVQRFVAAALIDSRSPVATRRELLRVLARSAADQTPSAWLEAVSHILRGNDAPLQREVLALARTRRWTVLDPALQELSLRNDVPLDIKTSALASLAPRMQLERKAFNRLTAQLKADDPVVPVAAATALGTARLSPAQRTALIDQIAQAGPLTLPLLARAFHNTRDSATAVALAKSLEASPGLRALPSNELEQIFGQIPAPDIATAAPKLFRQGMQTHAEQAQYLAELGTKMDPSAADARRGEKVFFAQETTCSVCHQINGKGGTLGPDLSRIGSVRATRALLESIVFPSSGVVPDFRAYTIILNDGKSVFGMISRETPEAIFLRGAMLDETRIARSDIRSVAPSETSYMPAGLEKTMTPQQLTDLLEYLFSLK